MNITEPQVTVMAFAPIETAPELHNVLVRWDDRLRVSRMAFRAGDCWHCAVTGKRLKPKPSSYFDPDPR